MQKMLYCPSTEVSLTDYGIEIPLSGSRRVQLAHACRHQYGSESVKIITPLPYTQKELLNIHSKDYVNRLFTAQDECIAQTFELLNADGTYNRFNPQHATKPLSHLVEVLSAHAKGSFHAMEMALENGTCFYAGGGMHHAMTFSGRGFCMINDIMLGLSLLKNQHKIQSAIVIDVDVHKGDGTAQIAQQFPWCKTISIHMKNGWPLDQGLPSDPWFIPNDIDIALAQGEDAQYIPRLKIGLDQLHVLNSKADLAVVVLGADVWDGDLLPSASQLNLTQAEMLKRDIMIDTFLSEKKIPAVYLMAGGYGPDSWKIHWQFVNYLMSQK